MDSTSSVYVSELVPKASVISGPRLVRFNDPSIRTASPGSTQTVHAQGKLLPAKGIIKVSGIPGDRISAILVKPGDAIHKNDRLVELKSESIRKLELEAAELKRLEASAMQSSKQREADLAVDSASSKVQLATDSLLAAEKQLDSAVQGRKSLERLSKQIQVMRELRDDPITRAAVSRIEIETRETELERSTLTADQNVVLAENAVRNASLQKSIAEKALTASIESRDELVRIASTASLEKQIDVLKLQLDESQIRSPIDGTVLQISTEAGERVATFPIMEIADLTKMVCSTEVYEADVSKLAIGTRAKIRSAALSREMSGSVYRIDRTVGAPQMRAPNPMARTDFRSIPVWIELDDEYVQEASFRLQLQVDVVFTADSASAN